MENERFVVFYMGTLVVFNTNTFYKIKRDSKHFLVKFIALAVNFSKFELNLEVKW